MEVSIERPAGDPLVWLSQRLLAQSGKAQSIVLLDGTELPCATDANGGAHSGSSSPNAARRLRCATTTATGVTATARQRWDMLRQHAR